MVPVPRPGTNSSHTPEAPRSRMGCRLPSQPLNAPTSDTRLALGAHTANTHPSTPFTVFTCEPRSSYTRWWVPSLYRYRDSSVITGRKLYGSRKRFGDPSRSAQANSYAKNFFPDGTAASNTPSAWTFFMG